MATRNYRRMTDDELRDLARQNSADWHTYDNTTEEGRAAQDALHAQNVDIYSELDSRTGGTHTYTSPSGSWSETPGTRYTSDYPQLSQRLSDEAMSLARQSAPAYQSQYNGSLQAAAQQLLSRDPFSYDPQSDPLYSQYRKQYIREGQRSTADVLGQYAAMTGGMPSTAAVTAAQQAGDYYNSKLNDALPALYQAAYERYMDEENAARQNVNLLRTLENDDYSRYLDSLNQFNTDRSFGYGALRDALGDARADDLTQYQRYLDERENDRYTDETAYNRARAALEDAATVAQLGGQIGDFSGYERLGFTPDAEALLRLTLADKGRTAAVGSGNTGRSKKNSTTTIKAKDDPMAWLENYEPDSEEDAMNALRAQGINKDSAAYYAKKYMSGQDEAGSGGENTGTMTSSAALNEATRQASTQEGQLLYLQSLYEKKKISKTQRDQLAYAIVGPSYK